MPVIAAEVVRQLASFRGEQAPVTTCYLDVDGRRYLRQQDLEREMSVLLKSARAKADGDNSVIRDLQRIEDYVKGGLDRSHTRGLAIFSCAAHRLWEVFALPVPVQSRVVINNAPAVSQLKAVLEESEELAVLLADKKRARLFVFELGDLVEHSERLDDLPREYDSRGERDQGDVKSHVDAMVRQHLRHAADVAWHVSQHVGFAHLAIGAPEEIASELESLLHPYLRKRLCGRVHVQVNASIEDIRAAAIEMERRVERRKEADIVQRLREAVATGRRGVAGLSPVLQALAEHRVERLLVSQGYHEAGWRCGSCGALFVVGRTCRRCSDPMEAVEDVVEEAIEDALSKSCRVEICVGNADLDVLGRVGALLRY